MRDTFVRELERLAARDPRIFLITGDLGFGVLGGFAERLPNQYLNAGVAEQNMTGLAVGLALGGRIVWTYSIANFPILRPFEMVRNDAAYHEANVKIVGIGGGFSYGPLGMSHHATEDLAVLRALPGVTVVSPCCLWEVEHAVVAIAERPGTAYLRLDKSSAGNTGRSGERFRIGKARQLRDGSDATVIATGGIVGEAMKAIESVAAEGIECRLLSMHTIKPLDTDEVLAAARGTGGIVTVEEHTVIGGLGGAVAEAILEAGARPGFFVRVGLRDRFSSVVGSQQYLRSVYGMDADAIATAIRGAVRGSAKRAAT